MVENPTLEFIESEDDALACYELMRELRPQLASGQEFVERWKRQSAVGYRLLAVWHAERPVALAGFRVQENLTHGTHVYVDDLVTTEAARGAGHGRLLMDRLKEEVRNIGLNKLLLDARLNNLLGHRFYYRQGLLATAFRFIWESKSAQDATVAKSPL